MARDSHIRHPPVEGIGPKIGQVASRAENDVGVFLDISRLIEGNADENQGEGDQGEDNSLPAGTFLKRSHCGDVEHGKIAWYCQCAQHRRIVATAGRIRTERRPRIFAQGAAPLRQAASHLRRWRLGRNRGLSRGGIEMKFAQRHRPRVSVFFEPIEMGDNDRVVANGGEGRLEIAKHRKEADEGAKIIGEYPYLQRKKGGIMVPDDAETCRPGYQEQGSQFP